MRPCMRPCSSGFAAKEVQLYDVFRPYRPEGLRKHNATAEFY